MTLFFAVEQTQRASIGLNVHAGLFQCFHNPHVSDMGYRIFKKKKKKKWNKNDC